MDPMVSVLVETLLTCQVVHTTFQIRAGMTALDWPQHQQRQQRCLQAGGAPQTLRPVVRTTSTTVLASQLGLIPTMVLDWDPAPTAAAALPPGWDGATDDATGDPYYFNRGTGETTWTRPNNGIGLVRNAATDPVTGALYCTLGRDCPLGEDCPLLRCSTLPPEALWTHPSW